MTVFAYFFGEYKQYMTVKDTRTRMRELQVREREGGRWRERAAATFLDQFINN